MRSVWPRGYPSGPRIVTIRLSWHKDPGPVKQNNLVELPRAGDKWRELSGATETMTSNFLISTVGLSTKITVIRQCFVIVPSHPKP